MTGAALGGSGVTAVPVEGSAAGAVMLMAGPASWLTTGATGTSRGATSLGVTCVGRWIGGVGAGEAWGGVCGLGGKGGRIRSTIVGGGSVGAGGASASSNRC